MFRSYLRGMEIFEKSEQMISYGKCSDPTYEAWKFDWDKIRKEAAEKFRSYLRGMEISFQLRIQ